MGMAKRVLTVVGDPNQLNTWSSIPYFFLKAAEKSHFIDLGLPLQPEKLRVQRLVWNLLSWLKYREIGGFQYSPIFLNQLFAQIQLPTDEVEFISHFPLLPTIPWQRKWIVNYYIDATLQQNFEEYGLASKVGRRIREAALQQERDNYAHAKRIICMSRSAAKSVINDYKVEPTKVHVIPGGANLDELALPSSQELLETMPTFTPLRLGFIGKDWQRKGLPYLLQVAEVLDRRDISVEVVVIGPLDQELPTHPLIVPLGFVDKLNDKTRFIELVRSFHFGCLFSSAEAFGISNLECLRLGVPVLASRIGGIPDTVPEGLGFLFDPGTSPATVADLIESFICNPKNYCQLRQRIASRAEEFNWQNTIVRFLKLWCGSEEFMYDAIASL